MAIVQHQRLPQGGQVSIERLFAEIRQELAGEWEVKCATSPWPSKALVPRMRNLRFARQQTADVHHVIGDVHYLAFALPPDRLVLTIHDCATLNRLRGWKREVLKYFWFVGPISRAAVVTTISETTKEELRSWIGNLADKIEVIPNCVRSEFSPFPKSFDGRQPSVLQIGTGWNKNVERVAEALRGTGCRLEIVGRLESAQRATLEATGVQFRELGRVSDGELVEAFHRCDFLIFASLYEGFGLPILEAQAVGRPVITSNRSSMPEAAGDGALFVDPESVESIREAVRTLLADSARCEELIRRGFTNVKNFTSASIAARYAEIYGRVVRSGRAASAPSSRP